MSKRLLVIAGPDKGKAFPLPEGETVLIGRSKATETRLSDPHVSRVHCQIQIEADRVLVNDYESAGGTYVNAESAEGERLIGPNDDFQIGETHFRLRNVRAAADMATIAPPVKFVA